jgi:hypothetical protein
MPAALATRHRVRRTRTYDELDDALRSGELDAVYIALPNQLPPPVHGARGAHQRIRRPPEREPATIGSSAPHDER